MHALPLSFLSPSPPLLSFLITGCILKPCLVYLKLTCFSFFFFSSLICQKNIIFRCISFHVSLKISILPDKNSVQLLSVCVYSMCLPSPILLLFHSSLSSEQQQSHNSRKSPVLKQTSYKGENRSRCRLTHTNMSPEQSPTVQLKVSFLISIYKQVLTWVHCWNKLLFVMHSKFFQIMNSNFHLFLIFNYFFSQHSQENHFTN